MANAQEIIKPHHDSLITHGDTLLTKFDSTSVEPDSTKKHKIIYKKGSISKQAITKKIKYSANDSILVGIKNKVVQLYGKAKINYGDITVEADYIEINFENKTLFAKGLPDSTGKIVGKPVFKEKEKSFKSDNITYNFDTKKGFIKKIITQEGEGFLHGQIVKKMPDNIIEIKNGSFTTCDLDDPHFELKFAKAKVIPDNKIICGPAYMILEGVPTPLIIPFGFFPITKGRHSGIIVPAPGESSRQGFYLQRGGYYFGLSDYTDLELTGDIYTNLSWATYTALNYKERYKYSGSLNLSYTLNNFGDKGLPDFSTSKDFRISWHHTQDAKANPNSSFNASVDAGSSKYNLLNTTTTADRLSNSMQSSISYSKIWTNIGNFSINLRHSQNTLNRQVNLTLPEITFATNRFYPGKWLTKEKKNSKIRWYENISINYVLNARNEVNVADTNLFKRSTLDSLHNGMNHQINIQNSLKVLKYFSWSNSFNYTERWYLQSLERHWDPVKDTMVDNIIHGFAAARDFSFSSSLTTKIYGMLRFKKSFFVNAIRHVMTPSISFSYRPDFSTPYWGDYKTYVNGQGQTVQYSIFEQGIYGSPPSGKSGSVNFSLTNNLEMKVKSKKDTVTGTKKVVLIENLTIAGSYNLADVPLKWSKISLTGRTKLFNNINLNYNALFDPYVVDYNNVNVDKFEWQENHRLLRLTNDAWALSLSWSLPYVNKNKEKEAKEKEKTKKSNPYKVPWRLTVDYSFGYSNVYAPQYIWPYYRNTPPEFAGQTKNTVIQTLGLNGSIDITNKWKANFGTGYDFIHHDISYTNVSVTRDLHCWEMFLTWVPTGIYRSYTFTIKAKSSLLQDLKLEKKKSPRDNF